MRRARTYVVPARIDPTGQSGPTRGEAYGPDWSRTSRGLYVPAAVDRDPPEQRIVEAAAVLPAYGGVTGWAALRWMGGRWFSGTTGTGELQPVCLVTACDDIREQSGIRVSGERLNPADLTTYDGLRVTTAVRSAVFAMRYAPSLRHAVVVADMAMCDDLVSLNELWAYALAHPGWTGIPQCRDALRLAVENAWSPQEVRMRLVWVLDAGFAPPLCNVPVFDLSGRHIGTPDLFDPVAGVAGEYDGELHLAGVQRARDLAREDRFRAVGLEYFTVVAADWGARGRIVERMHRARGRASFAQPDQRAWTVEQPAWWVATQTVRQRRALDELQRGHWLGYRAG